MQNETARDSSDVTSTTELAPILRPVLKHDLKYLIIPLIVIVVVMLLSALVYLMARKKRLDLVRESLMHLYEFDSNENEWETPLMSSGENYGSLNEYSSTVL